MIKKIIYDMDPVYNWKTRNKSLKATWNKYHAKTQKIDGFSFDSKAEATYYLQKVKPLKTDFKVHKRFEIVPKFKLVNSNKAARYYTPDFVFYEDKVITKVVDVKGYKITADSSLRMRLFEYVFKVPVIIAKYDQRSGVFVEKEF